MKNNITAPDTRTKIFLVAARLFATRGYNGVSIREICEDVGVGKPTLYYYFKDKETLLEELFKYIFAHLRDLIMERVEQHPTFYERLWGLIELRQIFAKQFPYFIRFFVSTNILSLPDNAKKLMVEHINWVHTRMIQFLEEGKKEGIVKKNLPSNLMVYCILGGLNQLTMLNIVNKNLEYISTKEAKDVYNFWQQQFFEYDQMRRKK
jgi:AcrR family transcriptional regulator